MYIHVPTQSPQNPFPFSLLGSPTLHPLLSLNCIVFSPDLDSSPFGWNSFRFDLEQGQLIEECYPPGCLTPEEELDIAFSSFPDSVSQHHNRSSIHDSMFFFRIQRRGSFPAKNISTSEMVEVDGKEVPSAEKVPKRLDYSEKGCDPKYLYGFVFNRQRHDERLKRGGEQKSVVILSNYPYSSLFKPLLQIMGPLYFDIGRKALDCIAASMSTWDAPLPGHLMELPIGNATLKVNLPPAHSLSFDGEVLFEESASSMAPLLPTNQSIPHGLFHDSDVFGIFRGLLLQLWLLWELLLVGEPILIITPTPPQCCEAVASLVSLAAPLFVSVDFRPYFTIHDPHFAHLNSLREGDTFPPMLLGVTNLFFLKALRNIPHIISVGSPAPNSSRLAFASRASTGRLSGRHDGFSFPQLNLKKFSPSNLLSAVKSRRDGPLCLMTEHKEAIWSSYMPITKPDTSILNRLVDAGLSPRVEESMSVVNNEILRRHFLELTTNFLAPFGPYFRVNTPCVGSSPFVDPPPLPVFDADEFLGSLSARGPGKFLSKRMRSNWLDLYRRFMKGHNFKPWFQRKRAVAEQEQCRLWRQARMNADIQEFINKSSELEIVETFNAIERHLLAEMQSENLLDQSEATCHKLKGDLLSVFNVLPKDMQHLLLMNPDRATLLQ
ncbi:protein DENND6A isoform X2 [Cynara cardunculus var. scolymus]|uniref:protein DENND6A isoform X2 n=1 Tax=Cynara cardunculus var. scolymus TaxID=59895 RepID=UPI000D625C39|nr:protein DENND6A isoform X2 [Cynara cardunculus var. scolymus]